jgi:hypothetical protein
VTLTARRHGWKGCREWQEAERSAGSGVRGPPPQTQTVVVDMEVVRWLPGGEGSALREERHREVVVEQEEEERVAEAMRVAGRLAST